MKVAQERSDNYVRGTKKGQRNSTIIEELLSSVHLKIWLTLVS
jgi:hypothetical protein